MWTENIFISPKKENNKNLWGNQTIYKREMELRNLKIYEHFLIGMSYLEIAKMYHLSEKSIRRIVLNEKRKMEIEKVKASEILTKYGISKDIKQIYISAWEIQGEYVLKKYSNLSELKRNVNILKILYAENIPVPKIIRTLDKKDYVSEDEEYWLLTEKIEGENIVHMEQCDNAWFFEMGKILAKLHKAFHKLEDKINYWNNSLLGEMESWVLENLQRKKPEYLEEKDVLDSIKRLRDVYEKLPKGIIHRDVHLGNFLFSGGVFSGYIDFDLSQKNIRIFDLCYFMLGLLLEEEENKISEECWFEVLKCVVEGYDSESKLTDEERSSIAIIMENIELLFVAYFIGEQDEQAAKESARLYYFCRENGDLIEQKVK
jgi:Ser/Thr protein kinase RdoA (MazF antagonist)